MYGFIYITTNHVNGKHYIGQKKYDKNGKWKEYKAIKINRPDSNRQITNGNNFDLGSR